MGEHTMANEHNFNDIYNWEKKRAKSTHTIETIIT